MKFPARSSRCTVRLLDCSWPSWYWIPVVSSQDHKLEEMSVHVISESGVLYPAPNPASKIMYGQSGLCAAGIGSTPET